MANQKLIFSNDGTIKTIDNYVLSKEEESFQTFIKGLAVDSKIEYY